MATNHLCLSLQNPPKRSITSRVLKVPQKVQGGWSNDPLEEPLPESLPEPLPGRLPGRLLGAKGRYFGPFDKVLVSSGLCE